MNDRPRILALFGSVTLFGQERGNIEALVALKQQGCDVLCLIQNAIWNTQIPPALDARGLAWHKVPYIEHRMSGRLRFVLFHNPFRFLQANWSFFRMFARFRPTHIHAFNQLYVLNFLIGLLLTRTTMIYRAGDEPTVHNRVWRAIWRFVVWRTARFVANSEYVASALREHGVPGGRISVIYNKPPARLPKQESPLELGLPPGTRAFAYIGQIGEHKGTHLLVDAFRELVPDYPHARLLIAGRISEWIGDAWPRALRDRVVQDPLIRERIKFLGLIEDIPQLLARCQALVVPSLFEDPSPNVVMEAKQAGRAVIAFPRGGIPELITPGVDGMICSEPTVQCLAEALRVYLSDPELARRHGRAASESLSRLGISRFGEKWLEIYGSVPALDARASSNYAIG